jgi:hypothetical protein
MAENDAPFPDESLVERFMRETAHLSPEERQRMLDVLIKASKVRDARLPTAGAIEKAKGS